MRRFALLPHSKTVVGYGSFCVEFDRFHCVCVGSAGSLASQCKDNFELLLGGCTSVDGRLFLSLFFLEKRPFQT